MTTESFEKTVTAIPLMGFTTRIDRALRLAQKEFYSPENGGRSGVKRMLVLLTDGTQTKSRRAEDPVVIAEEIRR